MPTGSTAVSHWIWSVIMVYQPAEAGQGKWALSAHAPALSGGYVEPVAPVCEERLEQDSARLTPGGRSCQPHGVGAVGQRSLELQSGSCAG